MSTPTEQVVLLDEAGAAIGVADKTAVHHTETPLHLAFSVYVFDPDGHLLLTQRALDKPTFGGWWTNSCCGHPAPGEPIEAAVRRRVGQELGIELERVTLLLPGFRYRAVVPEGPHAGMVENEMCPVFVAVTRQDAAADPAEVADTDWVVWAAFRDDVLGGRRVMSPWCVDQLQALPAEPLRAPAADPSDLPPAARP